MSENYADWNRLSLIPSNADATDASTSMARRSSNDADEPAIEAVLQSLDDDKCRAILTTLHDPMSASELRAACDLSRSTVYRKLELLRDAELVREYTEIRRDGPNATLYERDFTDIAIGIDDTDEFTIAINRPKENAEDRLATFWSAMKDES